MFGYVVPDKPNILVKDYELYRAYYCGICKAIGDCTGQCARLTLSYDITLLAMFSAALGDETPVVKKEHCPIHWIKKVNCVRCEHSFETVAYINAILGHYKAVDDVNDEKRLLKGVGRAIISSGYKKAKRALKDFDEICRREYERLAKMEREGNHSLDAMADPFAKILRSAAAVVKKDYEPLGELFYNLGRYIYVIDALDDYDDDIENNRFNPLADMSLTPLDRRNAAVTLATETLNASIETVKRIFDDIPLKTADGPLSNIIYLGLEQRKQKVLSGEKYDKKSL